MSSINEKLDYLNDTKQLIRSSLVQRGQTVDDSTPFRDYASKILSIDTQSDFIDNRTVINDFTYQTDGYYKDMPNPDDYKVNTTVLCIGNLYSAENVLEQTAFVIYQIMSVSDGNAHCKVVDILDEYNVGDIKLFETVEEMQADTTAQKGDLAVVYVDNTIIPNPGDSISTFEPRTTVLLDSVVTEQKNISTGNVFRGQLTVTLQPTSCNIHYTSGTTSTYFDVTYESSDGQLYTRTDGGESSYTVLNSITFPDSTDTQILAFFATGSVSFNGLFKYTLQSDGSYAYEIAPSQLSLSSTSQILPGIIGYGSSGVVTGDGSIYDNTLTPTEYNTALNTSEQILGEEETANE